MSKTATRIDTLFFIIFSFHKNINRFKSKDQIFVLFFSDQYLINPVSVDVHDFNYIIVERKLVPDLWYFIDVLQNKSCNSSVIDIFEIGHIVVKDAVKDFNRSVTAY